MCLGRVSCATGWIRSFVDLSCCVRNTEIMYFTVSAIHVNSDRLWLFLIPCLRCLGTRMVQFGPWRRVFSWSLISGFVHDSLPSAITALAHYSCCVAFDGVFIPCCGLQLRSCTGLIRTYCLEQRFSSRPFRSYWSLKEVYLLPEVFFQGPHET